MVKYEAMTCPQCQGETRVLESRTAEGGAAIRRRRLCKSCGARFTSFERAAATGLAVEKRDGRRQPFNAEKLRGALTRAAHKRSVSASQVSAAVSRVEAEATANGGLIGAARISELCLEHLASIDRGAYLQFAGTLPITPEITSFEVAGSVRRGEDGP